ncbi:MAG: hypothetical protein WCA10_08980 [Terracidiphilus sp.]
MKRLMKLIPTVCLALLGSAIALAQQAQKPLTNEDVIKMVHNSLPESVIIASIRSSGGRLDTSPDALIALHNAGVTAAEMDAIMAATGGSTQSHASETAGAGATAQEANKSSPLVVAYADGKSWRELPLEKTSLAQTKTKPTSLGALSSDAVLAQSMQVGIYTTSADIAMHTGSYVGSSAVMGAGGVFSSVMAQRKPEVTYVWGVSQSSSKNVVPNAMPTFSVTFDSARRVNPEDFEPVILKLTPAQNSCRIVGATRGKAEADGTPAGDWQMYSHFMEDRVSLKSQKLGTGKYQITPEAQLEPGEYAVALRPVSKDKKFSGGDIARAQGEGLLFDAIWTFRIE